jgi:F-type H+-transporting ATPase subunit gamma
MPSLIDLRRRIRAVKNTQQITKAMKMVAASKLRRAQERIVAARPFANQMQRMLASVATRVDPAVHPLLTLREIGPASRTLVIVVAGDKGLCGSFNMNIFKAASSHLTESRNPFTLGLVGRKTRDYFGRRGFPIAFEEPGIFQTLAFKDAERIAKIAIDGFIAGDMDQVILVFNEFRSVISQRVVVDQLLPIPRAEVDATPGSAVAAPIDYLYDPSPQEIFEELLPRYIEVQIYRALLESNAAFFAAQMTAMDTATKNSAEMISGLTLYMNKVRQAAITREIIEVVSGAEAL